jgi:ABC-type nitrate/sulfonate/bicarbonate transport system ATPase subunit
MEVYHVPFIHPTTVAPLVDPARNLNTMYPNGHARMLAPPPRATDREHVRAVDSPPGWQQIESVGELGRTCTQSYTLFPWLSVLDNVCFGLRERGMPRAQQLEIAHGFIDKVGLTGFEHHYPKQLSGGMQQRTAIARALANAPRILLMDEPFGALDHQTRELMQDLLLSIWEAERKTVLFVTHDIDEAVFLATRTVVMSARPGRIRLDRPVDLPHPRHYSMKTSPVFTVIKAQLTQCVRAEVQAAQAAVAPGISARTGDR